MDDTSATVRFSCKEETADMADDMGTVRISEVGRRLQEEAEPPTPMYVVGLEEEGEEVVNVTDDKVEE